MNIKQVFDPIMEIFKLCKTFPAEEKYALSNQIVRASRSVCTAIAEAYRKRKYPKYFTNNLTDSENAETQLWLDFVEACNYLSEKDKIVVQPQIEEVRKLINYIKNNPGKLGSKPDCLLPTNYC